MTSPRAGTAVCAALSGYDLVTGLGSPKANLLVPDLVAYGSAAKLAVLAQPPGNLRAGASFGVSILVENSAGAAEQSFDGNVTISMGDDPGGGSLGGTLTVTAQDGVATFSGLTLVNAGAGYTLVASAGSALVTTSSFTVSPSVPARLTVISGPALRVGVDQAFALCVAVEDRFGNVENTYAGDVTISLAGGPSGRSLGGALTVNVQNGVAVFSGLKINRVGLGYSIKASGPLGIGLARTTPFGVVADLPDAGHAKARVARTKLAIAFYPRGRRLARHA